MTDTAIRELWFHQAWADAEHWRALTGRPAAMKDMVLWERLQHIHLVQWAYLLIVRRETPDVSRMPEFADAAALELFVRRNQADATILLDTLTEAQLEQVATIPWFPNPPVPLTVRQALLQAPMHSQYHRGQNAMRLRELGGDPPATDFVAWLWQGKPYPVWG
jgi:uncharacterized damage-inducible protein DinB